MRVIAYVDSLNLYYRALRKTPYKWLNLEALIRNLLDESDEIIGIKYFTARVSGQTDLKAPARQHAYLRALESTSAIHFFYGRMLKKKKYRPLVSDKHQYVEIHDTEEKGTDVSLAVHMLNDAWKDEFDLAILFSQDTDLLESVRIIREELGKKIGVIWLDGREPSPHFIKNSDFIKHLTASDLGKSQFNEIIIDSKGKMIRKPDTW